MKNKIITIIIIILVVLGGVAAYKAGVFTSTNNSEQTGDVLTVADYDGKKETLERLGFSSVDDIANLSDGTDIQEEYVERLKNVFELLDTVDQEGDMVDATLSVGLYLNLLGETDLAIEQYEYLLINRPTHSTVMNNLAWIYIEGGEYEKAEEYFKTNIENNPDFSNWYINLADLYRSYIPEKKSEIPTLIQGGIDVKVEDFALTMYLAEYYESEKDYEKALDWYNKALEINPNASFPKQAIEYIEEKMAR